LGPADFAKVYNVPSTLDGTGQQIAIVADSNINPQDVADFQALFGLPANPPNVILNGPDSGLGASEGEADLDVQVSGMVAQKAVIDLVVSEDTLTAQGIDLSAFYIIDNNIAPVMSESFGDCESNLQTAGNQFFNSLWEQAAAEGISVFVSSGDPGSAGCDNFNTAKVAMGGSSEVEVFSESFHRSSAAQAFSGADQGCGRRASRKAKMVMSSARATSAPSRMTVLMVSGSGVAKQPQLICKPRA